ncbi:hypothetical protein [Streptomyces sp. DHE17-7]|uniref:hypothetical protein n=1 Tax=Streptomyces sp. DHE17-7 TaxID=2759949 RepID=UPI0022EA66EC|nr:hypothetical protein [Streptomyces sp. DHE17-7]MBJ6619017.1 hypothetical protein [Streptomyces sp. DHE17-7]
MRPPTGGPNDPRIPVKYPGVAALALTAAASAVAAGYASERRARAASRDAGA